MKKPLAALLLLAFLSPALHATVAYDGIIFGRVDRYDSYPSHLFFNGKHHIWWCSQGSDGYDAIYFSTKNTALGPGGWTTPARVFTIQNSPWAARHTCDPSVIRKTFSYQGTQYSLALYYTSWKTLTCPPGTLCPGGRNAIGVAFSNDGSTWTSYPSAVLTGDVAVMGDYGAGQSGVAVGPDGVLKHAYTDTTRSPFLRQNQTTNGFTFTPNPSNSLLMTDVARGGFGNGVDIAYHPGDGHWYAVIKTADPAGQGDGETRVLRSYEAGTLGGYWEVIGVFNSTLTGWQQNQNPGLGKNGDGSLYVDAQGWAYTFFGVGNPRPDVASWEIAQGRFRPRGGTNFYTLTPCRLLDTRSSPPGAFSQQNPNLLFQVSGVCSVPAAATAVALNLTTIPQVGQCPFSFAPGDVVLGTPQIVTADQTRGVRSTSSVLPLSRGGEGTLLIRTKCTAGSSSHLIIDVAGYFAE